MFITWVSSFFFWKNQLLILFCFLLIHPTLGRFLLIFIFVTLQIYQSFWCKLNLFYVHILLFKSNLYLKKQSAVVLLQMTTPGPGWNQNSIQVSHMGCRTKVFGPFLTALPDAFSEKLYWKWKNSDLNQHCSMWCWLRKW